MINFSKKIWIWIASLLLVTNLSTISSYWYHKKQEENIIENTQKVIPAEQRARFFKDQLVLDDDQLEIFRQLNQCYNRNANKITRQLDLLRLEMIQELGQEECDSLKLRRLAGAIGEMHRQLKEETIHYYLEMKKNLNADQQYRLYELFKGSVKNDEELTRKGRGGYRWRKGRGNPARNE